MAFANKTHTQQQLQQESQQEKVKILIEKGKQPDANFIINVGDYMNSNSNNTSVTGNVSNSAIGVGASSKVKISGSYNNSLTSEQQADLIAALNQLVQKVAIQGADTNQLQLLTAAKQAVEQKAAPQDERTQSFLHTLYTAMTEVDKVAGMAEKAHKYIGPLVLAGTQYLGLM